MAIIIKPKHMSFFSVANRCLCVSLSLLAPLNLNRNESTRPNLNLRNNCVCRTWFTREDLRDRDKRPNGRDATIVWPNSVDGRSLRGDTTKPKSSLTHRSTFRTVRGVPWVLAEPSPPVPSTRAAQGRAIGPEPVSNPVDGFRTRRIRRSVNRIFVHSMIGSIVRFVGRHSLEFPANAHFHVCFVMKWIVIGKRYNGSPLPKDIFVVRLLHNSFEKLFSLKAYGMVVVVSAVRRKIYVSFTIRVAMLSRCSILEQTTKHPAVALCSAIICNW